MTCYCPSCWREVKVSTQVCPFCRQNIAIATLRSFEDKLISALHHPEPQTPIRVAAILQRRKTVAAVPALRARLTEELTKTKPDPYLLAALIKSIYVLGGLSDVELQSFATAQFPVRVRAAVDEILATADDETGPASS